MLPTIIALVTVMVGSFIGGIITGRGVKYVLKDALLEKIDDAIAHLSDGSITEYYESLVYKDIRELIESM